MGKAPTIEQTLARLKALATAPDTPEVRDALSEALSSKTNLIVARAAEVVAERKLGDLSPAVERAYERFIPAGSDKGCVAKTAIARALYELGASAEGVFLHGVTHVQPEPSWGGRSDSAAELRGYASLGLVRTGHRQALTRAADLLADPQVQARVFAARALAYAGHEHGALPLRVKVLTGDAEPEVMAECFAALLKLSPAGSVPLVGRFLEDADDAVRQNAALALGESRLAAARELLERHWRADVRPDARRTLALALATHRSPEAVEFLLAAVRDEPAPTAAAVVEAMRIFRYDESIAARVREEVTRREHLAVTDAFSKAFE